jgi:hypothetical protein
MLLMMKTPSSKIVLVEIYKNQEVEFLLSLIYQTFIPSKIQIMPIKFKQASKLPTIQIN